MNDEIAGEADRDHRTEDKRNDEKCSGQPSNSGAYGPSATTVRPGCQPATSDAKRDPKDKEGKDERRDFGRNQREITIGLGKLD
jgi:hypothetical protein